MVTSASLQLARNTNEIAEKVKLTKCTQHHTVHVPLKQEPSIMQVTSVIKMVHAHIIEMFLVATYM